MVGVLETGDESYLVEPVSGTVHIAYEVKRSPLPEVENIGGSNEEGALPCPKLEEIENGVLTVDSYDVGSTATYQCARGYRRFGPRVRQCLPTALWSGNTPVCVPRNPTVISSGKTPDLLCPELRDPQWGAVAINFNSEGNTYEAVYSCEAGRSLNGGRRRYCISNSRRWSGEEPTCIPDEMLDIYINGLSGGQVQQRKRRQADGARSMEIMVFVDSGVVAFHGSDIIVNYILAIMNIMASLYRDPTLEAPIDLVISRLIIEEEGESSTLNLTQDASEALNNFCQFQLSLNNVDEANPLHHDHALLITSVDLCVPDTSGECNSGVIGFAPIGGMCSLSRSCTINEDRGLGTAFVLAHETGHNLGMQHDGFMNECVGSRRIMATSSSGQEELFRWSPCSAAYLTAFLSSGNGECLDDLPIGGRLNASSLEGLNFDVDAQCRAAYGPSARLCPASFAVEQLCSRLWCQPAIGQSCFTRNVPPADGSSCGDNMVCIRGSCEEVDDTFLPINGGWSSFGSYGECSRTCESGVRFRERRCNSPTPAFGGEDCEGESREYEVCNTDPCPEGTPDFRDVQCSATDGMSFNGRFHAWESYNGPPFPEFTPCGLVCQADGGLVISVRAPSVIDGTKCTSQDIPTGVCIQGACIPLGCDNVLNSDAREDVCGICNGDNSTATIISDSAMGIMSFGETSYVDVGVIPVGAREITIVDSVPFTVIALQLGSTSILNGDYEYFFPGSYIVAAGNFDFVYNRSLFSGVDVAFIDGPLSEPLFIRVFSTDSDSYSVNWEYTVCDTPLPSTTSISQPTSTVSTTLPPASTTSSIITTISTTSVTSSIITPVSTTVISQPTSSTLMTQSTSTVLVPTLSISQDLTSPSTSSTSSTSSMFSTTSPTLTSTNSPSMTSSSSSIVSPTLIESSTSVITTQVTSSTFIPQSTSVVRPTSSSNSTTTTTVVSSTISVLTTTAVPETTSIVSSSTSFSSFSIAPSTTFTMPSSAPPTTTITSTTTIPSSSAAPPTTTTTSTTTMTSTSSTTPTTTSSIITPSPIPTPMDCITYDVCGVCNGDNSSASVVTNSLSQSGEFGYYDAVTIPTGARHIMVYEDPSTTDNFIALAVNGINILNGKLRIKSSTVFTDNSGVVFTYTRSTQESVSTTGPLSQPLTVQGLIGVSRGTFSLSWSYVECDVVTPTSSSSTMTTTKSSTITPTPTPEILFPLWSSTRYGRCFLNDEGMCLRSREVFCEDGLTGLPLSDDLCAARRKKPSTTLRCGARLCQ